MQDKLKHWILIVAVALFLIPTTAIFAHDHEHEDCEHSECPLCLLSVSFTAEPLHISKITVVAEQTTILVLLDQELPQDRTNLKTLVPRAPPGLLS